MNQQEREQRVVPFFKIQGKDFSFQLDELTPIDKVSLEKENLMVAILDTINDGVVTIDFNMRITSFNRAAERITGFSSQEAIGRPCVDIFCHGKNINMATCISDCTMKMAVTEGRPITRKKTIVNRKGEILTISSTGTILYDLNGRAIGGMSTFVDITAFEKLKEECQGRKYILGNVVGKSNKMMEIYNLIDSISDSRANVLIQGETGTGKGLIANAIHFSSINRSGPFIHVNCAALPENLLESELFGHVKGAFTGAVKDHQGRLELAQEGTIFLDEIGELSLALQAKLLRVVEEKTFERVGDSKTMKADVRIISASNKDLEKAIKDKSFREDLFYRLNVIPIKILPLRERKEDIPLLVNHFIEKLNFKMRKEVKGISSEFFDVLFKYQWPGNVRELENVLEFAFVHSKKNLLRIEDLPPNLRTFNKEIANNSISNKFRQKMPEKEILLKAIENCHWNRTKTAKYLNLSRTTLWRMMKKYEFTNQWK